jgi:hypothetical protein
LLWVGKCCLWGPPATVLRRPAPLNGYSELRFISYATNDYSRRHTHLRQHQKNIQKRSENLLE